MDFRREGVLGVARLLEPGERQIRGHLDLWNPGHREHPGELLGRAFVLDLNDRGHRLVGVLREDDAFGSLVDRRRGGTKKPATGLGGLGLGNQGQHEG